MLKFLKVVREVLLAIGIIGLAIGTGAALSALGAVLGTALLGGVALLGIVLVVRELFQDKS